ncbi:MAG: ATP-binding cassette domain-containing protein, partial [Chitinophagaceae bacterium]|nr:ATP-binding cassette domain-containing protein [Chitinophagaceae bacterium]
MGIVVTNASKRFSREWIFRKLDFVFSSGNSYAITGPNGSGKSTLLQTIAGSMELSEGGIEYRARNMEHGTDGPA